MLFHFFLKEINCFPPCVAVTKFHVLRGTSCKFIHLSQLYSLFCLRATKIKRVCYWYILSVQNFLCPHPEISLTDATFILQNCLIPGLCACCLSNVDIDVLGPAV